MNAARVILGWQVPAGEHYAHDRPHIDPNREHPPAGKLLIAGSMRLFGDTPLGWRFPSIITGLLAILLLYAVAVEASGDAWLANLAAFTFAFDNLVLVHSRIGTLDMPMVAALLLAAWSLLRGRTVFAGLACAAATLIKFNAIYGLLALLLFLAWEAVMEWRRTGRMPTSKVASAGVLIAAFLAAFMLGLWLLDRAVTTFQTPWDHVRYILNYGLTLTRPGGPANTESYPWQWLANDVQIPYFRIDTNILVNHKIVATRATVLFRGAMNPFVIGMAPLGLAFALWRACSRDRLAIWTITWFLGTYLPYYPLSLLDQRISYIYYFLPTIPAVAVSLAMLVRQGRLPAIITYGSVFAILLGFAGYFPFRTIL